LGASGSLGKNPLRTGRAAAVGARRSASAANTAVFTGW
jgi:hypothetical protein